MKRLAHRALAAALAMIAFGANGAPINDPANDFLPTYTGPQSAPLDALSSEVRYLPSTQQFLVTGTMNGPVAAAPAGSSYIWGFNRGAGTERFVGGTPSTGEGVSFDSVVVLLPDGTGTVNRLVGGGASAITATIAGNTISTLFGVELLPTLGLALDDYLWNLWPRSGPGNAAISDFLPNDVAASNTDPNAAMARVTVVPEPNVATLFALGLAVALWRNATPGGGRRSRAPRSK
jgi:hypothetical protein